MTREEILAMEPGRILDALVEEYVVGLKEHRKAYPKSFDERVIWFGDPPNVTAYYVPFYSTDISAAWEVVEKVDIVEISKSYRAGGEWYWGVFVNGNYTYAKSVPEAICKAALLAVMNL